MEMNAGGVAVGTHIHGLARSIIREDPLIFPSITTVIDPSINPFLFPSN